MKSLVVLTKLHPDQIRTIERTVTFSTILDSDEPSVMALRASNYNDLVIFVTSIIYHYLSLCYPNNVGLAPYIAEDLIETRPTWKAADFINLCKFLRQRSDLPGLKSFGNQITLPRFMEMIVIYEEHRAAALEEMHYTKKSNYITQCDRTYNDTSMKSLMGKELELISAKRMQFPDNESKITADENYFKSLINKNSHE